MEGKSRITEREEQVMRAAADIEKRSKEEER